MSDCPKWVYHNINQSTWNRVRKECRGYGIHIKGNQGTIKIDKWGVKKVKYNFDPQSKVGEIHVLEKNSFPPCSVIKKVFDRFLDR